MFADASYLLMTLRDHILNYGVSANGQVTLHQNFFIALIDGIDNTQYKICPKINWDHIQVSLYYCNKLFFL